MDINKQDQVAGDNSAQFQANTINNNFYTIAGVSEEKHVKSVVMNFNLQCKIGLNKLVL